MNSVRDCLFPPSIPYFLCLQSKLLVRVLRVTGGPRLPAGSDPSTYQRRGYRRSSVSDIEYRISSVSDIESRKHSLGDASENPVTDVILLAPLCSQEPPEWAAASLSDSAGLFCILCWKRSHLGSGGAAPQQGPGLLGRGVETRD